MLAGEQAEFLSYHAYSLASVLDLVGQKVRQAFWTAQGRYFFAGVFLSIAQPPPPYLGPNYITRPTVRGRHTSTSYRKVASVQAPLTRTGGSCSSG